MTVSADEFLRRFRLRVLPKKLARIRHFGIFTNHKRETAPRCCRQLLGNAVCTDRHEPTNLLRCPAFALTAAPYSKCSPDHLVHFFSFGVPVELS
jgi:hypothetical protein